MDHIGILIAKCLNRLYKYEEDRFKDDGMMLLCSLRFCEGNRLTYSVSATHDVFHAMLLLKKYCKSTITLDCTVIMTCCLAIVRFVNNMTDAAQKSSSKKSIHITADMMNIPRWLVEMRHSIVHSHVIMDEDALKNGLLFCIDWLCEKYWSKFINLPCNNIFQHLPTTKTATDNNDFIKLRQYIHDTHMAINKNELELLSRVKEIFLKYENRLVFYELILQDISNKKTNSAILCIDNIWLQYIFDTFPYLLEEFLLFIVDKPDRLFKWATKSHLKSLVEYFSHFIDLNNICLEELHQNITNLMNSIISNSKTLFQNIPGNAPYERTKNFIHLFLSCLNKRKKSIKSPSNNDYQSVDFKPKLFVYINNKFDNYHAIHPIWNVPLGMCIGPRDLCYDSFVKFEEEPQLLCSNQFLIKNSNFIPTPSPLTTLQNRKRPKLNNDIELL